MPERDEPEIGRIELNGTKTPPNVRDSLEFSVSQGLRYYEYPVLVVDDEPENLQAFLLNFRDAFTVHTAESGEEALRMLGERQYAVLLSDQRMPGMSGVELLERSVADHPDLVRVIVTGYTDNESLIQAINQGRIYHYVTKPWNHQELGVTLRRAIERYAMAAHNRKLISDLQRSKQDIERKLKQANRELQRANERWKKLAVSDGLTGLYNHRYFQERWRREVQRARRYSETLSLMIIDVDNFKNFNDTMGHPQGDVLLKEVSTLLTRSVREVDLVARYGGEEFVIVLPKTPRADAIVLAQRVRSLVGQHPFRHRDVQPGGRLTVSIGVSAFPEDGADASEVIIAADKALYRAKNAGRDEVMAAAGMSEGANGKVEGDEDLDFIVEEDGQARVAALSATDLPVASGIDTLRLRVMQEEREAEISSRSVASLSQPGLPVPLKGKGLSPTRDDDPSMEFEIEVLD
jgi:diguanylate cyclase (GGDEF)-like protein